MEEYVRSQGDGLLLKPRHKDYRSAWLAYKEKEPTAYSSIGDTFLLEYLEDLGEIDRIREGFAMEGFAREERKKNKMKERKKTRRRASRERKREEARRRRKKNKMKERKKTRRREHRREDRERKREEARDDHIRRGLEIFDAEVALSNLPHHVPETAAEEEIRGAHERYGTKYGPDAGRWHRGWGDGLGMEDVEVAGYMTDEGTYGGRRRKRRRTRRKRRRTRRR